MSDVRCPVVELRQYTLHDGQRDALIDLFDREFVESQEAAGMTIIGQYFFDRSVRPVLTAAGAAPLACLQTEQAENTFPALPVREGENVFAWFARFSGQPDVAIHQRCLKRSRAWRDGVLPELSAAISGEPQRLRLAPTARSLLR